MKNKLKFLSAFALLTLGFANAQVGLGTTTPNASSELDVSSTTKGLLLPRLTTTQRDAIVSPAEGLAIYNTTTNCLNFYNGTAWNEDCGAAPVVPTTGNIFVAPGVTKTFLAHNLGADTSLDPNTPVQGIHGNYYQWGRAAAVADANTPGGAIGSWNGTDAANGSWTDATKTANDPCPAGFRIPTKAQWDGVVANNTVSRTGSFANDSNFGSAIHFGTAGTPKILTLPAAGYRNNTEGSLFNRGFNGFYWSSTENSTFAWNLFFNNTSANTRNSNRTFGLSVRCVSE